MASAVPRGRFVWHELLTTNPDAAVGFYEKLVGWKVTRWEHDPSYRMFTFKGTPRAGLMPLPDDARKMGSPSHWLSYVAVPDVNATVKEALDRGATTLVEPMDVPHVGRLAVLADPQGAAFAVFRPSAMPGDPGDEVGLGDFSWHELATTDWGAAWEFYRVLFGWEVESQFDMGPGETYWMFKRAGGSRALGGMFNKPKEMPVANWLPYILVPSADRATDVARLNQGMVLNGPMDVPGGDRIAQLMDRTGAATAVHSRPPKPTPAPEAPKKKAALQKKAAPKKKVAPKKKAAPKKRVAKKAVKRRPAAKKARKRR